MNKQKELYLLKQASEGNQQALALLYKEHSKRLLSQIKFRIKNDMDAEDLMIESFQKAFTHLKMFDSKCLFWTWLSRIARNHCMDFCKKNRLKYAEYDSALRERDKSRNPEQELISKENVLSIERIIEKMNPARRQIMELRTSDLKCKEIAAQLGITISAVTGQIRYAKNDLINILT